MCKVLSASVPAVISGENELVGDWLSCLEVIMRDTQFVIPSELYSVHSIMIDVITANRPPLHMSTLGALTSWIRRCVMSRNRAVDIGYALLPAEIESIILPLNGILGKEYDFEVMHQSPQKKCKDSFSRILNTGTEFLSSVLACYCALLQLQFVNTPGHAIDVLVVNPRKLPLRSALFFIGSYSNGEKQMGTYREMNSMEEFQTEFRNLVEKFNPELFLSDIYNVMDPILAKQIDYLGFNQDAIVDVISNSVEIRFDKDYIRNKKKRTREDLSCKFTSLGLTTLVAAFQDSSVVMDLESQQYFFDIWQLVHSKSPCPQQFELLTLNSVIDAIEEGQLEKPCNYRGLASNADYTLRSIPSYDSLVREPLLLLRLPELALSHPLILRIVLFILKSLLFSSKLEVSRIEKLRESGKLDHQDSQQSSCFIHVQDIIVVRLLLQLCTEFNQREPKSRNCAGQISDLVASFLENHLTSHCSENLELFRSVLTHGIDNYHAFSILFSRPKTAFNLSMIIFEDIKNFSSVMPLPLRFWIRTSEERRAVLQVSEKFIVENNGSPRQHFGGSLRHLAFLLRVPFICPEVETLRGLVASAIPGYLIGLLSMMEAPYLFDDVVKACLNVVNCLKPDSPEGILSSEDGSNFVELADVNRYPVVRYPGAWLQLLKMLQNVKGEDQSALKKFAYTVFGVEQSYHAFQQNLHLKEAEKSVLIEDYGKIYTADIAWSALHPMKY